MAITLWKWQSEVFLVWQFEKVGDFGLYLVSLVYSSILGLPCLLLFFVWKTRHWFFTTCHSCEENQLFGWKSCQFCQLALIFLRYQLLYFKNYFPIALATGSYLLTIKLIFPISQVFVSLSQSILSTIEMCSWTVPKITWLNLISPSGEFSAYFFYCYQIRTWQELWFPWSHFLSFDHF